MSDPPKKQGGHAARYRCIGDMPLYRPHGVAHVLIYPCGKAQKQPPGAAPPPQGGARRSRDTEGCALAPRNLRISVRVP